LPVLDFQLSINPALAGIKHLNRLEQVLAGQEIQRRNAEEGLVLDREGRLIEALSMNIFLAENSVWHTPQLTNCGIAGTARQYIIDVLLPKLGKQVVVANIKGEQLGQFDQAFLVNSVKGLWPVATLANRDMAINEDLRYVQQLLMAEVTGQA
jgi:4-amino-4-deoxychorismate lyase